METPTQVCTFSVNGHLFGVDVLRVQEVIRFHEMTPVPLASNTVRGLINLRGQIVTALDLRLRLNLPPRPSDLEPMNVIVRSEDGAISLLVDEIGEVVEVSASGQERPPETLRNPARELVTSVYKLKDRLLLILDIDKVIQLPAVRSSAVQAA